MQPTPVSPVLTSSIEVTVLGTTPPGDRDFAAISEIAVFGR
jgi:hypothetical protein